VLQGKLVTFYNAIKAYIPTGVQITVPSAGAVVDSATGQNTAMWAAGSSTIISGTHSGAFTSACGFTVNWNTSVFNSGRRLRGKTFIVPAGIAIFDSDGTLGATQLAVIRPAASAVPGGADGLVVYSRKLGSTGVVTTADVPDKQAVLRSRRD
jgi:hypothetical protein